MKSPIKKIKGYFADKVEKIEEKRVRDFSSYFPIVGIILLIVIVIVIIMVKVLK